MEAIVFPFSKSLKGLYEKVNDEFEPLVVVNKNPEEDIVVLSKSEWDSLQETLTVARNTYLSQKFAWYGSSQSRANPRTKPDRGRLA